MKTIIIAITFFLSTPIFAISVDELSNEVNQDNISCEEVFIDLLIAEIPHNSKLLNLNPDGLRVFEINDLDPGSYDIRREVRFTGKFNDSPPNELVHIQLQTKGDLFCSYEVLLEITRVSITRLISTISF